MGRLSSSCKNVGGLIFFVAYLLVFLPFWAILAPGRWLAKGLAKPVGQRFLTSDDAGRICSGSFLSNYCCIKWFDGETEAKMPSHLLIKANSDRWVSSLNVIILVSGLLTTSSYPAMYADFAEVHVLTPWFRVSNIISFLCSMVSIATSAMIILALNKNPVQSGPIAQQVQLEKWSGALMYMGYRIVTITFFCSIGAALVAAGFAGWIFLATTAYRNVFLDSIVVWALLGVSVMLVCTGALVTFVEVDHSSEPNPLLLPVRPAGTGAQPGTAESIPLPSLANPLTNPFPFFPTGNPYGAPSIPAMSEPSEKQEATLERCPSSVPAEPRTPSPTPTVEQLGWPMDVVLQMPAVADTAVQPVRSFSSTSFQSAPPAYVHRTDAAEEATSIADDAPAAATSPNYLDPDTNKQLCFRLTTSIIVASLLAISSYQGVYAGYSSGLSGGSAAAWLAWFCTLNHWSLCLAVVAVSVSAAGLVWLQNVQTWPQDWQQLPEPSESLISSLTASQVVTLEAHAKALLFLWHASRYGLLRRPVRKLAQHVFTAVWGLLLLAMAMAMAAGCLALRTHIDSDAQFWAAAVGSAGVAVLVSYAAGVWALGGAACRTAGSVRVGGTISAYVDYLTTVASASQHPIVCYNKSALRERVWQHAAMICGDPRVKQAAPIYHYSAPGAM
jgi:hypothetical protein